jgi:RimJ/RimL family protein N-acetyltransferase
MVHMEHLLDRDCGMSTMVSGDAIDDTAVDGAQWRLRDVLPPDGVDPQWCPMPRTGRFVSLEPITRRDLPFLFRLVTDEHCGPRWRLHGAVPREEVFERHLWEGILAQFLVTRVGTGREIGLVSAYGANAVAGTAKVGVSLVPSATGKGYGVEAFYRFAGQLFATWNLRKLYLETPAYNAHQFRSAIGRYMRLEGCLKEDEWYGGQYWDSLIIALYREDFTRFQKRFERFFAPSVVGER